MAALRAAVMLRRLGGMAGTSAGRQARGATVWPVPGARPRSSTGGVEAAAVGGGRTHFDVLGVGPDASPAEVKKAYLALARVHHPDVAAASSPAEVDGPVATTIDLNLAFKEIVQAYDVLKDPARRDKYVAELPVATAAAVAAGFARETAAEVELRELIEKGDVDAALKKWEEAGATLQSLLHIIRVCTKKKKIPHDLPGLLQSLHKADQAPTARGGGGAGSHVTSAGRALQKFVEKKTQAYNDLIRLADICGTREQLFEILDHMEEYKVPIDWGTFSELAVVFTKGSRRQNPNR